MFFNRLISYLFHPIIFPLIGSVFFTLTFPRYISQDFKITLLTIVFVGTYLMPILLLTFLKKMEMIKSFHLPKIEERKFPILLFAFIALLIGKLFFKTGLINDLALFFIGGGLSFLLVYAFLWFKIKVSVHTLGIGGLIGFVINMSLIYQQNYLIYLSILFIAFGIIAYARLKLKAHVFHEVILGLLVGVLIQFLVFTINF